MAMIRFTTAVDHPVPLREYEKGDTAAIIPLNGTPTKRTLQRLRKLRTGNERSDHSKLN